MIARYNSCTDLGYSRSTIFLESVFVKLGDVINVTGCVTQDKFIAGRSLVEIEDLLGFKKGRCKQGIAVATVLKLPEINEFDLDGYSNVPTHRHTELTGFNIERLKAEARLIWTLTGWDRLVKVLPTIRHDSSLNPDVQYPIGRGVPQWIVRVPLPARVCGLVSDYPNSRYIAT